MSCLYMEVKFSQLLLCSCIIRFLIFLNFLPEYNLTGLYSNHRVAKVLLWKYFVAAADPDEVAAADQDEVAAADQDDVVAADQDVVAADQDVVAVKQDPIPGIQQLGNS